MTISIHNPNFLITNVEVKIMDGNNAHSIISLMIALMTKAFLFRFLKDNMLWKGSNATGYSITRSCRKYLP